MILKERREGIPRNFLRALGSNERSLAHIFLEGLVMPLERKPVKSQPEYPDLEQFMQERRTFLLKLSAVTAGFVALSGCSDAKTPPVTPNVAPPPVAAPQASIRGEAVAVQPPAAPQACTPGKPSAGVAQTVANDLKRSMVYSIEGEDVAKDKFDAFLKSLKQVGNAFCERTTFGGNTGYNAVDAAGLQYTYREEMGQQETRYSIAKKTK